MLVIGGDKINRREATFVNKGGRKTPHGPTDQTPIIRSSQTTDTGRDKAYTERLSDFPPLVILRCTSNLILTTYNINASTTN